MLNSLWNNPKRIWSLLYHLSKKCIQHKFTFRYNTLPHYNKKNFIHYSKNIFGNTTLMAYTLYNSEQQGKDKVILQENYQRDMLREKQYDLYDLNSKSSQSLMELMHTINFCIIEITQQYRQCLAKQINITSSTNITDENWDDLIRSRVEAEELKLEFDKYKLLVHKMEQYIFSHAVNSLMNSDKTLLDDLNHELNILMNFLQNLEKENKDLEIKLLKAQRNSIILGLETVK